MCITGRDKIESNEILVVSFGTTSPDSRLLNIDAVEKTIREAVPDDYDMLIQLCDAISGSGRIMDIIERMSDVRQRYGDYDRGKWNKNLELKEYFEKRMNRNLYDAVEKDSFHI